MSSLFCSHAWFACWVGLGRFRTFGAPRMAFKVEKPSRRGVGLQSYGPYCFYQFFGSCPCALCTHTCVSCCHSSLIGSHTAAPSRSWDHWLRQTSRPHCGYTLIWPNEQIESETLHGTGSLEDPLQWYLLEFTHVVNWIPNPEDKVINKTGHPAYWTRHIETLKCQPT